MKGLFHHVRMDRTFGGSSISHSVLASIQLQGWNGVIVGFEKLFKVVGDTKGVPMVPGSGVSPGM